MRIDVITLVNAQTMASTITSQPQQVREMFAYSIQAVFTTSGTLAGTFKLQGSNTYNDNFMNPSQTLTAGTWTDINGSSETISGAGSFMWNDDSVGYLWVRLVYTPAGGDSGSCTATFVGKGF